MQPFSLVLNNMLDHNEYIETQEMKYVYKFERCDFVTIKKWF